MIHGTSLRGRQEDEEISSGGIQSLLTLLPAAPSLHKGLHIWATFKFSSTDTAKLACEKPLKFNIKFTETFLSFKFQPLWCNRWGWCYTWSTRGVPADAKHSDHDCSLNQQQQREHCSHILQCSNMNFSCWHISLTSGHLCLREDWFRTVQPLLSTIQYMWFYFFKSVPMDSCPVHRNSIYQGFKRRMGGFGFYFTVTLMTLINSAWFRFRVYELSAVFPLP